MPPSPSTTAPVTAHPFTLGVNLCFAVKRMLDPEQWATFVRDDLGVEVVQLTFDLIDPWWPDPERSAIISRIRRAADSRGLTIHSACVGLAHYVPGGLLDPDSDARALAVQWWRRAIDVAAELEVTAVGGPLGSMTAADAAHPRRAAVRWDDLVEQVTALCEYAAKADLGFLIEPTPIPREIPSTIVQGQQLLSDLDDAGAPGTAILLDIGHTVYEPLYGPSTSHGEWIRALGDRIGVIHLDNTDRRGDPHWGWPDPRGRIDVGAVYRELIAAGLADVPVMLEVFPRFEDDDDAVRDLLISSVAHCRDTAARLSGPGERDVRTGG
jgi:D-erythrulose 1-phosphate 3-epimerase